MHYRKVRLQTLSVFPERLLFRCKSQKLIRKGFQRSVKKMMSRWPRHFNTCTSSCTSRAFGALIENDCTFRPIAFSANCGCREWNVSLRRKEKNRLFFVFRNDAISSNDERLLYVCVCVLNPSWCAKIFTRPAKDP